MKEEKIIKRAKHKQETKRREMSGEQFNVNKRKNMIERRERERV